MTHSSSTVVLLGAGTPVAFAVLMLLSLRAGAEMPILLAAPLALACGVLALIAFLYACAGSVRAQITYLVALVFINDGLFRVRDPGDLGLDWQNAMKFALWGGAAAIGLAQADRIRGLFAYGPITISLVYITWALLSSFYSAAPSYSFSTAFGMLSMLLFGLAIATNLTERQLLMSFTLSLLLFILAGWVVYYQLPALGRSPFVTVDGQIIERMCGLAGQANALGGVIAVYLAAVFLLWYRGHRGLLTTLPLAAVGVGTLLVADSRTALLAALAGMVAVLVRRSMWTYGLSMLGLALAVLLGVGVPLRYILGFISNLSRSGDPTEIFTLTGRTEIWEFAWSRIVLRPWLGYGYNSSKFILPQFWGLGLQVDEAHNMWLQNLLAVGIVGTVPLVALCVWLLVDYLRAPDPFRDLLTVMMLVWGITVAGAFGSTPTVMTLAIFTAFGRSARRGAARAVRTVPPPLQAPGIQEA